MAPTAAMLILAPHSSSLSSSTNHGTSASESLGIAFFQLKIKVSDWIHSSLHKVSSITDGGVAKCHQESKVDDSGSVSTSSSFDSNLEERFMEALEMSNW